MNSEGVDEKPKKMSKYEKWSLRIAGLGLIFSIFGIGFGAYISLLQSSISASLHPQLQGMINETESANITSSTNAALFLSVSVSNLGSPSIVNGYQLMMKLSGANSFVTYNPSILPEDVSGDDPAHFSSTDALYEKTDQLVPSGAQITGWLFFVVPGVTSDEINASGTQMIVQFKDVTGKLYSTSPFITTGKHGAFLYVPGGGQPFEGPNLSI